MTLRDRLRTLLGLAPPTSVIVTPGQPVDCGSYTQERVTYPGDEGAPIPAFLMLPKGNDSVPGVVVFHQHNGEFHLGKSEVAGLAGDPLQAFGPALAARGIAVLAPDALTFEERRAWGTGIEKDDRDWLQHYNAMAHRLVRGELLLRKSMDDAERALSALSTHPRTAPERLGTLGHSFGGLTALYHSALDPRVRHTCISGAVCSFETRFAEGTGINMLELVPGIAGQLDPAEVLASLAPRPTLVVSSTEDAYARDADAVLARAADLAARDGNEARFDEIRVIGEHALDPQRFGAIVEWMAARAHA